MTRSRAILATVPPLLVGVSIAAAAEMSASLLLYSAEGFLPALTLILTVETGALALGLWSGTFHLGDGAVEQVRRRWLFSLVTFALAAVFSTGMTFIEELLTGGIGQGLGLAFLGSLPLFALGSLLGAMARPGGEIGVPTASIGIPSVVGVAVGFLLTGGFLLPNMAPYTVYLACLTSLSGGALFQGWVLDGRPQRNVLERRWSTRGEVRVEERLDSPGGLIYRVLLEEGRVRGSEGQDGSPGREWEAAVLAALKGEAQDPGNVLFLGGGSGTFARLLSKGFPETSLVIVEGSEEVIQLARTHLHAFLGWSSIQLHVGDPWSTVAGLEGRFPLILMDSGLLPTFGLLPSIPTSAWTDLARLTGPGGTVVLGGLGFQGPPPRIPMDAFKHRAGEVFERVIYYQGEEEGFLTMSGPDAPLWPPSLPGFSVFSQKED